MALFSGRSAEISEYEPGWVAKTAKPGYEQILELEAGNYRALTDRGLPMPRTRGVIDGRLILEHIPGDTMLAVLERDRSRSAELAAVFLDLWERVHAASPAGVMPVRARIEWGLGRSVGSLPAGEPALCHYDFHPGNVILAPDGAVVIDWVDALAGPVAADYARTLILLGFPGRAVRVPFTEIVYDHVMSRASDEVREWLPIVAAARLAEGDSGEETTWLRRVANGDLTLD